MKTRIISSNKTAYYIIALLVIVIAFLLLGGGPWIKGLAHTHGSNSMASLRYGQILIGAVIGFLAGIIFSKRR
jgi:type III secretory pathway component EscT